MAKRPVPAAAPRPLPAPEPAIVPVLPVAPANDAGVPVVPGRVWSPDNPHTWLPLLGDPPGTAGRRIMHGTLRRNYDGHANSAEAFARAKLQVVPSPDPLAVTALRHEVLVPDGADDVYADPWVLPRLIDHAAAREIKPSAPLLCYVTVTEPDGPRLHEQWRRGRALVERLVKQHAVPMLLVQHAPAQAGSGNAPHLHILAATRALGAHGFGATVAALVGDRARGVFVDAWAGEGGK